ncbi:phospholipase D-like domain-containing protein [Spirosoma endophyticum]|uniref:phospholipase D n=1 Tax=Spirosoma endophyticum TaxID=662367 RepID=A0A1I1ZD24_9BACT|nr:phospholipase D-like domain-containing protein [Spirosoma endophyticum]SFE29609.1 PLD-like domain-containing protein [Spirosoma endophyticum]
MPSISVHFIDIKSKIREKLRTARESVQIAVAWFTDEELMDELIELKRLRSQLKIQIVISYARENFLNVANLKRLRDAHIELRVMSETEHFLHHKFCIIDSKIIINGSYNWTYYAATRNDENIMIITAEAEPEILFTQFNTKFNRYLDPVRSSPFNPNMIIENEIVYLNQYDVQQIQLRQHFQQAVQQSLEEIDVINPDKPRAERVNTDLINDLIQRHGDGVQMVKRLIANANGGQAPRQGFIKLALWGRLDLSFEHLALQDNFQELFTQVELNTCSLLLNI